MSSANRTHAATLRRLSSSTNRTQHGAMLRQLSSLMAEELDPLLLARYLDRYILALDPDPALLHPH
eukprot:3792970-Rhodomonas_salina.1